MKKKYQERQATSVSVEKADFKLLQDKGIILSEFLRQAIEKWKEGKLEYKRY